MKIRQALNKFFRGNDEFLDELFDYVERLTIAGTIVVAGAAAVIYPWRIGNSVLIRELVGFVGYALLIVGALMPVLIVFHYWGRLEMLADQRRKEDPQSERQTEILVRMFKWPPFVIGSIFFLIAALVAIDQIGH